MKTFCFTVDDNIRFLKELAESRAQSLFDHPYTALYKRLHEKYNLKVQLNLFYEMPGFNLSQMPDRFREEFSANAHWLKLSFHSRLENTNPYRHSGYDEVFSDCEAVHREILRFAGKESLGKTTTIHYCKATKEGVRALWDQGVQGILGLFGTDETPRESYSLPEADGARLRRGEVLDRQGMRFYSLDLVMNLYGQEELRRRLQELLQRDSIRVMIHEQYFYSDYRAYQPDFGEKLDLAFSLLTENRYESRFVEELDR